MILSFRVEGWVWEGLFGCRIFQWLRSLEGKVDHTKKRASMPGRSFNGKANGTKTKTKSCWLFHFKVYLSLYLATHVDMPTITSVGEGDPLIEQKWTAASSAVESNMSSLLPSQGTWDPDLRNLKSEKLWSSYEFVSDPRRFVKWPITSLLTLSRLFHTHASSFLFLFRL